MAPPSWEAPDLPLPATYSLLSQGVLYRAISIPTAHQHLPPAAPRFGALFTTTESQNAHVLATFSPFYLPLLIICSFPSCFLCTIVPQFFFFWGPIFSDLQKKNESRSFVIFVLKHTFCFDKLHCFVYRKVLTAYIYFLKDRT